MSSEAHSTEPLTALPGSQEAERSITPSIQTQDVWIRYLIRYHRSEVTLRETLIRQFDLRRGAKAEGSRWHNAFWALRGVTLTANPGDVLGIIGRNGSGKTTLLKTLAGILGPDRGLVAVRGRVACLLSFGAGFHADLTGLENIYLNGTMLGLGRKSIDDRIGEIIEFSELGDFINAPIRTYSTGMRARLGFSIAALMDPDVLILDEVIWAGDASFRLKTGTILDRFRHGSQTIVFASHSMELIRESCNRAVWLDAGQVQMTGPPDDVTQAYESFVRTGRREMHEVPPATP